MALLPGQRSRTSLKRAKAPRTDVKGLERRHCQPRSGISRSLIFFPSSSTIWIAILNLICPFSKIKSQYGGINRRFTVRRDGFRHRLHLDRSTKQSCSPAIHVANASRLIPPRLPALSYFLFAVFPACSSSRLCLFSKQSEQHHAV